MAPPALPPRGSGASAAPSGEPMAKLVELVPERLRQVVAEALVVRRDAVRLLAPGVLVNGQQGRQLRVGYLEATRVERVAGRDVADGCLGSCGSGLEPL